MVNDTSRTAATDPGAQLLVHRLRVAGAALAEHLRATDRDLDVQVTWSALDEGGISVLWQDGPSRKRMAAQVAAHLGTDAGYQVRLRRNVGPLLLAAGYLAQRSQGRPGWRSQDPAPGWVGQAGIGAPPDADLDASETLAQHGPAARLTLSLAGRYPMMSLRRSLALVVRNDGHLLDAVLADTDL